MTGKMILKVIILIDIFYHIINSQWLMFKRYYWRSTPMILNFERTNFMNNSYLKFKKKYMFGSSDFEKFFKLGIQNSFFSIGYSKVSLIHRGLILVLYA